MGVPNIQDHPHHPIPTSHRSSLIPNTNTFPICYRFAICFWLNALFFLSCCHFEFWLSWHALGHTILQQHTFCFPIVQSIAAVMSLLCNRSIVRGSECRQNTRDTRHEIVSILLLVVVGMRSPVRLNSRMKFEKQNLRKIDRLCFRLKPRRQCNFLSLYFYNLSTTTTSLCMLSYLRTIKSYQILVWAYPFQPNRHMVEDIIHNRNIPTLARRTQGVFAWRYHQSSWFLLW